MRLHQAVKFLFKAVINLRASNKDEARREFILNVLLVGLLILTAIGFSINILHPLLNPSSEGQNPLVTGLILLFIACLLVISQLRKSQLAAQIFIWFLFVVALYMSYFWGTDLPAVLLFFALLIVMAGILINSKFAFVLALLCGSSIITFTYLESVHYHKPHNAWKNEAIQVTDSIVYAIILGIIAVVAWLSNREMEKALKRARNSETLVKRQKDNLEIIVEERTRELKQSQAEKLTQLYRFAEFGRMASGLFHDFANPLTLVSLNLDRLRKQSKNIDQKETLDTKILLKRALNGTHRLEKFIQAARKQVKNQDLLQTFSLKEEVAEVIQLLGFKARKIHVTIESNIPKDVLFYGNSIKFNQLMTNLVSNAIDAYDSVNNRNKVVVIRLYKIQHKVQLEVSDWGSGITKKNMSHVFEPLFTTKSQDKGIGIGLSICQDIVEKDLKGKILAESNRTMGTTFIISFPIKKQAKKQQ